MKEKKQETNAAHSLNGQVPAETLSKRECFLSSVRPAYFPAKVIRCSEWQHRQNLASHNCAVNKDESLANGHTSPWAAWRYLNRLRTGVACSKEQRKRWKYFNGDTTCECGQGPETTKHILQCPLLAHPCTLDDLQTFNENIIKCADKMRFNDTKEEEEEQENTTLQQTSSPDITTVSNTLYNGTSWTTQHALSSDHLPIVTTINIRHDYRLQQNRRTFTNHKKADWTQFRENTVRFRSDHHTH